MFCCSRKTLFILLGVAGIVGLFIATGKVNAYAIVPFLPILLCPLLCGMMMCVRKDGDGHCRPTQAKKPATTKHS